MRLSSGLVASPVEEPRYLYEFSICTFVTNEALYEKMLQSFANSGFNEKNSEFIYVNNVNKNTLDAFEGVNRFIWQARGRYVLICHQDVEILDNISRLLSLISELDHIDPSWALIGNAGGYRLGGLSVRISDPNYGPNFSTNDFPRRVDSLDENFILIKAAASLSASKHLSGFHFYGTDLCLLADFQGYSAYVVDFLVFHAGGDAVKSTSDSSLSNRIGGFNFNRWALIRSFERRLRPRWIQTTCARIFLSSSRVLNFLLNRKIALSIAKRLHLG